MSIHMNMSLHLVDRGPLQFCGTATSMLPCYTAHLLALCRGRTLSV